jgi:voltage-gated potassium channel
MRGRGRAPLERAPRAVHPERVTARTAHPPADSWRERLRVVIHESDTPAGRAFDVALLLAITASVVAVMLESVPSIRTRYGAELYAVEWLFTALFSVEYALRLATVPHPWRYARSFFGVVDLLAVLPTYASLFFPGAQQLLVIRGLRLLRVFRIFKLGHFVREGNLLRTALATSRHKITVFLGTVVILVVILGTAMYLIEGEEHGFTSIPISIYWAVVTMTTVGYGDLAPKTVAGKLLATVVMILGYSIIAVPTGIVTAEIVESTAAARRRGARACPACGSVDHDADARFCKICGASLGDSDAGRA